MKQLAIALISLLTWQVLGQTPKGVTSQEFAVRPAATATTRAVVVGISDYQDPAITDLHFADRDAEAFAAWLRSPAGGSLNNDQLKLLTNQRATVAQFGKSLDWLIDESKEGDQAIIYFSGHGDVETKTYSQQGYLLCWDSPPQSYMTGAFAVYFLKDVVATLTLKNKARAVVITDACHAGTLAGSSINGSQLTSQNLAQQFANEIKILSCQPDEFSVEGVQWGDGRGVFSYYLVDGLYGLADGNSDGFVNLMEIGRYLEDHVTPDVAPISQVPMVSGNKTHNLGKAIPDIVADIAKAKSEQMPQLKQTNQKGIEEDVLATLDTMLRQVYQLFTKSLENKQFLQPAGACADSYYGRLIAEPKLARLHNTMRRNYAAALQDDAQQVLNKWMKTDMAELMLSKKTQKDRYQIYPRYLDRAAELLGDDHYMHPVLKARKLFFEGYLMALSNYNPNQELGEAALSKFREALGYQPNMSPAYWQMSAVFGNNLKNPDSAAHYAMKAATISPAWLLPYTSMAYMLINKRKDLEKAKYFLGKASEIDSSSTVTFTTWGFYYLTLEDYNSAEQQFKNAINKDPLNANAYTGLAHTYFWSKKLDEAEVAYETAFGIDSTLAYACINLGFIYSKKGGHIPERENLYLKAIELDSTLVEGYYNLGNVYLESGRFSAAEKLHERITIAVGAVHAHDYLAFVVYTPTGRYQQAVQQYIEVIRIDSTIWSAYANLGKVYQYLSEWEKSAAALEKAVSFRPQSAALLAILGNAHIHLPSRIKEGEILLQKALELKPTYPDTYIHIAQMHVIRQQKKLAWEYLEKGLEKGIGNGQLKYDDLQLMPDFAKMRKKGKWQKLMKKYFPDKVKD